LRDLGIDGRIIILKWSREKQDVQKRAEEDFCGNNNEHRQLNNKIQE
jgi:hypothetical protein